MVSVVLVSVAVIPALYLILQVRKYDRLEKEPVGLIVSIVISVSYTHLTLPTKA